MYISPIAHEYMDLRAQYRRDKTLPLGTIRAHLGNLVAAYVRCEPRTDLSFEDKDYIKKLDQKREMLFLNVYYNEKILVIPQKFEYQKDDYYYLIK